MVSRFTCFASLQSSSVMALFLFLVVERIIVDSDEQEEDGDAVEMSRSEAGDTGGTGIDAGDADGSGCTDDSDSDSTKRTAISKIGPQRNKFKTYIFY